MTLSDWPRRGRQPLFIGCAAAAPIGGRERGGGGGARGSGRCPRHGGAGGPAQPHDLHQQPQREDQEGRAQEVPLRHLLAVRADPGHPGVAEPSHARPGLRHLQGAAERRHRAALHAGLPLLRQAHAHPVRQDGLGHHRQDEGHLRGAGAQAREEEAQGRRGRRRRQEGRAGRRGAGRRCGNAAHEPGAPHDAAHAGPALHDPAAWHGSRWDAPREHAPPAALGEPPQPHPLPHQPPGGDQRAHALHALQPVPGLQGGAPGAGAPRHRLRGVRHGGAGGGGARRAPGLQDHPEQRHEDLLRQEVTPPPCPPCPPRAPHAPPATPPAPGQVSAPPGQPPRSRPGARGRPAQRSLWFFSPIRWFFSPIRWFLAQLFIF